ncbi:hypothetical protein ACFPN7_26365 [Amycolatopsis halotolerans]
MAKRGHAALATHRAVGIVVTVPLPRLLPMAPGGSEAARLAIVRGNSG